tara:strand:+ start:4045 stop:4899 length:855 start_codon:yes stop_codon:yes gene_type:complete
VSLLVAPLEALTDPRLSDPERRVLLALFSFRGKNTDCVWPSVPKLAERSLIRDFTRVSKITTALAEKGWLTKNKRSFSLGNEYFLSVPDELLAPQEPDPAADQHTANLDSETKLDRPKNEGNPNNANLDSEANLNEEANLDENTCSNLDSETKSNLDSETSSIEQTSEQTNEHTMPPLQDDPRKFAMKSGWQPSDSFPDRCAMSQIDIGRIPVANQERFIGEFKSYWMSRTESKFPQSMWDHKLLQRLLKRRSELYSPPDDGGSSIRKRSFEDDLHDESWVGPA